LHLALTSNDWQLIRDCALLKAMDQADLGSLIDGSSVTKLSRNQQLFAHGDPAKALFLVLEGQIKLSRLALDGNEAVVHVFGPGESFAEAAMFMGGRYPVAATAIDDARLIAISNARLRARVLEKPEIAFAMLGSMAMHLKTLVAQIEQIKLMTAKQRTTRFLLDQAKCNSGPATFTLPHDKALIANRLGMKPETFSRSLAQLVAHGVDVNGASITIRDVQQLVDLLVQD
jgi:CRP/FNR family transcriptional regulator, dissimilatory nitrate respiration regulator